MSSTMSDRRRGGDATLLAEAVALARAAGGELARRFPGARAREAAARRGDGFPLAIEHKGRRDLVTAADLASEERILDGLSRLAPGVPVLSEERGDPGVRAGALWIVDPLDGTTNFAHGHPLYTVSIALCRDGVPELGVVHAPELGDTWWASRGGGAFQDGVPIRVTEEAELVRALLATGFSYEREELSRGALEVFARLLTESREVRRGGSACLDLAHVASGVFAGYWELHLKPHDVAAGALLVREAGGLVTDYAGGEEWLFGESLIAGSPAIHARLLAEIGRGIRTE
jgi:myo-inositol-1(or 4)-monophosphatase